MSVNSTETVSSLSAEVDRLARHVGIPSDRIHAGDLVVNSPIDGLALTNVKRTSQAEYDQAVDGAQKAFKTWRALPAPARGGIVRRLGDAIRKHKTELAKFITFEVGKIESEALGEVQEAIDICDYAVGLSRQLSGLTIASERPEHHLLERWHPLGTAGIITAFNFPMAVWAWNAALALVCGNTLVWKPSEKTPLCALALNALLNQVLSDSDYESEGISAVVIGGADMAEMIADDNRINLVSATGSTAMGRNIGVRTAGRFAKTILELGGNSATVVMKSADLDMALSAIVFGSAGTAGQRCTSLRRVFAHVHLYDELVGRIRDCYERIPIGDPREEGVLVGPLIGQGSYDAMSQAMGTAAKQGGTVHGGERVDVAAFPNGVYVRPALVEFKNHSDVMQNETFAPLLYIVPITSVEEAIELNNCVSQGLSSSIFTTDLREADRFLSATGSDCGIANVNVGTSGAEIGGAFGGEKETGGGRESGSDAWKGYMRRQTQTVNYSNEMPLAQGVQFDIN